MDVEEKQEMLDVGVKKSGRDAPSSVGCVPCWRLVWFTLCFLCVLWRLADMEFVKPFTKSGVWVSIHDVFFSEQV